jgi:hypothetical protein
VTQFALDSSSLKLCQQKISEKSLFPPRPRLPVFLLTRQTFIKQRALFRVVELRKKIVINHKEGRGEGKAESGKLIERKMRCEKQKFAHHKLQARNAFPLSTFVSFFNVCCALAEHKLIILVKLSRHS